MVMSLMLTSPPYFLGFYGRSNNDNTCWIQGTLTRVTVLHWSILFSWMILSILYIFWVTLWTYQTTHNEGQKVKSDLPPIQYLSNNSSSNTSQSESLPCAIWDQIPTGGRIRSALRRITIYPFVWAILQSIFVIFGISSMLNRPGHNSRLVLVVLTAVHGIVHSVTFCWDPTVQVCLNTLSTDLLEQYHSRPRKAGLRSKLIYLFCKVIASEDQTKSLQDELLSQSNSDSGTRQSPAETLFANSKFDLTLKTPTRAHFFNQSEISVDQMSYSTGSQERKLKLGLI
ncbi:hypothetical protein K7432_004645 [Basidiobolus ranarum]|uniref:G-protein coupled receptors family 2 profile 2 domain-containing protein n=1 Tax=Basidiobolus ranarum TaxID=34480 RepID=A0ABR2WY07_9FUNG